MMQGLERTIVPSDHFCHWLRQSSRQAVTNQFDAEYFRRNIMAKGQQRKSKEVKKPKQDKKVVVVTGSVIPARPIASKK